ncbi:AI-2E family transporter [bacterium]|nr:AI-2E family transporter [bacterium]
MNLNKLHPMQMLAYSVIIMAGMYAAASVISLILLSLLLAISVIPLVSWLIKHRIPKWLAITLTILIFLLVISIINFTIVVAVHEIAEKLPQYKDDLFQLKLQALNLVKNAGIEVPEEMAKSRVEVDSILQYFGDFISGIVSIISNFMVVFLMIIFMVVDITTVRLRYEKGEIRAESFLDKLAELAEAIRKYVSIAASTGLLTAAGNLILLLILGVDYPFLWAFLSFLFSFIPNIGFIFSIIPPAFLALTEISPVSALIVVVGFFLINEFIEDVIKPRMMGEELDLSLSVVFISLVIWAFILGPIGTVLAIPMTITVKMAWGVYMREE